MTKRLPPPLQLVLDKFAGLKDPRIERTKHHPLENILVMSLCATICGAKGWDDIAEFAESYEEWFEGFLRMPRGTPSADTFRRVFEALDPEAFERSVRAWVKALGRELTGEVVAIDGKSISGAVDRARPTVPLHLLHVWATEQGLVLAQKRVAGAPGEVRAVQEVVRELELQGAVVTADANSCTAETTRAIRERGADFVLAIKGSRGPFHKHVLATFAAAQADENGAIATHVETNRGHGRDEQRVVRTLPLSHWPARPDSAWTDVRSAVLVERTRTLRGKTTTERGFYITSLPPDAPRLAHVIRAHWGIENRLHWCLDVTFGEDQRRVRDANAAQNFATVARLALMLLKRTPGRKKDTSIARKRKLAGWRTDYLVRVLLSGFEDN